MKRFMGRKTCLAVVALSVSLLALPVVAFSAETGSDGSTDEMAVSSTANAEGVSSDDVSAGSAGQHADGSSQDEPDDDSDDEADEDAGDAAADTTESSGSGKNQGDAAPLPSVGASFEEYIAYGKEHQTDVPDPQHMWNTPEAGISQYVNAPYWQTSGGVKSFYDGTGELFASPALKVLDVSSWQGSIDWQSVKNSDVDAVILRAGYGVGNLDKKFAENLEQVRKYKIPYGIYFYSYAYDAEFAKREADWLAEIINRYDCDDLSLPVYYDIEAFEPWKDGNTTRKHPTTVSAYEKIVSAFVDILDGRGIDNVHVYSYRAYMQSELNSSKIWAITSWIAEYNPTLAISNTEYSGQHGWQYTSSGSVSGVSGPVDLSAFTDWDFVNVANLPTVEIPDGVYYLNALLKDSLGVQIAGDGLSSGAATELGTAAGSGSQRFIFTRQDDGSYVIENEASGLVLDVQSAKPSNGAKVQQYAANGTDAQRWFIRDSGSGYYLQSALGNWVIDIAGAQASDGTSVRLYEPNGSSAQLFMPASADVTAPQGVISIGSVLDNRFVLDVKGASTANNAAVQLYAWNQSDAQLFTFEEVGNGLYSIVNVNSGKVVEVSGGKTADASKVAQYADNGSLSQHWSLRQSDSGSYVLLSNKTGKALGIASGKAESGKQLQIYTPNGTAAQEWSFTERATMRDRIDSFAQENKGTIEPGVYAIGTIGAERQVLDVKGASQENKANVQLYASNGANAQRWRISEDEQGYLTITNVGSGRVLDINGASKENGANVQQYSSNGSYAQKWIAVENADGSITFYSALKEDFVLDAKGGKTANSTNIDAYASNGTNAQKFKLCATRTVTHSDQLVEDGTYTIAAGNGRVLDVPGAKTTDGVQLQSYSSNGSAAQYFHLSYHEDVGLYSIQNIASGRVLDAAKGDCVPATPVNQWGTSSGSSAQRYWALEDAGSDGFWIVNSANGQALGLAASGKLVTVPKDDDRAVAWSLEKTDIPWTQAELDKIASSQGAVIQRGTYTIASAKNNRMVLDIKGGSKSNGANVQLYTSNKTTAQKWEVEPQSNGYVRIVNVGSGRVLDVKSGSKIAGANVQQYGSNGSRAQLWLPVRQDDSSWVFYSALGNGLVLDVKSGSMKNSANVQVYTANGTIAQQFILS